MSSYSTNDATGMVIASRYRLISLLGRGPFAHVYLADDVRLRRRVACKVLDRSLVENQAFIDTFQTEMHAAGSLRHPHVVVIHDWGMDDDVFVVSEYLENGSLRQLIDRGSRFSLAQALQLGLAAARGLAAAHERGVVHRDLRPANLLFGIDERVRITDFGLARAFAEAATTAPMGQSGVAVRYAAPEQAKGENIDGKADVYALALCLIEAVTGSVPFVADTALATLMARVGRGLDVPEMLGPLRGVLERAGTEDPTERLDAAGLATAFMAIAGDLPEPLPLQFAPRGIVAADSNAREVGQLDDITLIVDPEHSAPVEPAFADSEGIPESQGVPESHGVSENHGVSETPAVSGDDDDLAPIADSPPPSESLTSDGSASDMAASNDAARRSRNRRRGRRAWIALCAVIIIGGGIVGGLAWRAHQTPKYPVPSIVSLTKSEAVTRLTHAGFTVKVVYLRRDGTTAGQVLGEVPAAGTKVPQGASVQLQISAGQTLVALPKDLVGQSEQVAQARLTDVGLRVGRSKLAYSETVDKGNVISIADGLKGPIEKGSTVTLVVSNGPEPRVIPSVQGMTPDQAQQALEDLGLVPQVIKQYDTRVDTGGLIGVAPSPGTSVPRGATVQVLVSKGLLVAVPSLGGVSTVPGAIAKLTSAGLVANNLTGSGNLSGTPVGFDPPAGTLVVKGTQVNIVVR